MKKLLFIIILSFLSGQEKLPPLSFEIFSTFVNDDNKVTVQFNNQSKRTVSFLEGFITVKRSDGKIIKEIRLPFIDNNEPALPHGAILSRSVKFPNDEQEFYQINFQVSKLKFSEDYRLYTWHPSVGFIRID